MSNTLPGVEPLNSSAADIKRFAADIKRFAAGVSDTKGWLFLICVWSQ